MPECFLQGYFPSKELAMKHSIDLNSGLFLDLLKKCALYQTTTLLLGLNEKDHNQIFNTVVVIEKGQLIGKYRKAYSYPPYDYYSLGNEFPIFEKKNTKN